MSRPEITVTERQIVVVTEAFRLHVEFGAGASIVPAPANAPPPATPEGGEITNAQTKTKRPKFGAKECKACSRDYTPTGPAQQFCEHCKPKKGKKRLEELDGDELDKTLEEIENRRKRPYKFTK